MDWEPVGGSPAKQDGALPRKGRKKRGCLTVVVAVIVIAVIVAVVRGCGGERPSELVWPTSGLATLLPEPPSNRGDISSNSDDHFSADVEEVSAEEYSAYLEACKDKGFTVDGASTTSGSYDAYNEDGYSLSLLHFESNESLSIRLEAPVEMSDFAWPTTGLASLVPAPASTTGAVTTDSSTKYTVTVGDTSPEDFTAYVDALVAAGFTVDYQRGDTFFEGDNAAGAHVRADYRGFNMMSISVDAPEQAAPATDATTPAPQDASTGTSAPAGDTSGVSPDFKATMDSYEAFFNEYATFMETYTECGNPVSILADYTSMMQRYNESMQAMNAIDENSLSAADLAYYLEVTGRINERLLQVAS